MGASLSFSSCKYNVRAGRAETIAGLIKDGFAFTIIKTKEPLVVKRLTIDGKSVSIDRTNEIVAALNGNKDVTLYNDNGISYKLSAIEKSGTISSTKAGYNAGDVAEGIFAIALAARFTSKDKAITVADLKAIKDKIKRGSEQTSSCVINSPNKNPSVIDKVNLDINLAKSNLDALLNTDVFSSLKHIVTGAIDFCNSAHVSDWASMLYTNNQANTIKIISDGIGNQKGSKMDVQVLVTDKKGTPIDVNMNYSLKAGDVKQFGQIGGGEFEKQVKLWGMFGLNINSIEDKYNLGLVKDPHKSYTLAYEHAVKQFNQTKRGKSGTGKLLQKIIAQQMAGDEDIVLVQLKQQVSVYNPKLIVISDSVSAAMKRTGESVVVQFWDIDNHILDVRIKYERATGYVRNIFEKGKDLHATMH